MFNKNIKRMTWKDIASIKLSVLFFTLMLVKIWPAILSFEWYIYLIFFIIFATVPIIKVFKK